jgi:hypothetical protein
MKNARNSHRPAVAESWTSWRRRRSNVGPPGRLPDRAKRKRMPTNRSADPAIVNRKNFTAA